MKLSGDFSKLCQALQAAGEHAGHISDYNSEVDYIQSLIDCGHCDDIDRAIATQWEYKLAIKNHKIKLKALLEEIRILSK